MLATAMLLLTLGASSSEHPVVVSTAPIGVEIKSRALSEDEKRTWVAWADHALRSSSLFHAELAQDLGADPALLEKCRGTGLRHCAAAMRAAPMWKPEGTTTGLKPRLILVLLTVGGAKERHLQAFLIDVLKAVEVEGLLAKEEGWEDQLEDQIFEKAVIARLASPRSIAKDGGPDFFFLRIFKDDFSEALQQAGRQVFGSIRIQTEAANAEVKLDGFPVGSPKENKLILTGVLPGAREIHLTTEDCPPVVQTLNVRPGAESSAWISPVCGESLTAGTTIPPEPDETSPWFWVGIGASVLAAGATAAVLASVLSGPEQARLTF